MKTHFIIVIAIIVLSCDVFGQSGWFFQQSGTNKNLYDIYFINSNTGWAVGLDYVILKTTNSGINWITQFSLGIMNSASEVFFINENTGLVAGGYVDPFGVSRRIMKTTDGGQNWFNVLIISNKLPIKSVFFINSLTGWFGSFGGFMLKTTNFGNSFIDVGNYRASSIFFNDVNTGFLE